MQPHSPVAGGADFVALKVEELVGRNILGKDIATVSLEHRGEDDAMEDDIVLADKVYQLGIAVLPPLLPIGAFELLGEADIADRSVEPDIEHFAFCVFDRHFDAPVEVAGDGTRLKTRINPRLALSVDVGLPVAFVLVENPFAQPGLVLVEGEVPMLGLLHHGRIAAEGRLGVDEVRGIERGAASLTLVAVGMFVAAVRAGACDIAVGEELVGFLVVVLHGGLLNKLALFVELLEVGGSRLVMLGAGGAAVDVERDAQLFEGVFDDILDYVNKMAGATPLCSLCLILLKDLYDLELPDNVTTPISNVDIFAFVNKMVGAKVQGMNKLVEVASSKLPNMQDILVSGIYQLLRGVLCHIGISTVS